MCRDNLQTRTLADRRVSALCGPLSPADYLRLRRVASGYSPEAFARALLMVADHGQPPAARAGRTRDEEQQRFRETLDLVRLLETGGTVARRAQTLHAIQSLIPFDPDVYHQLANEPADRHPRVCRGCGCSGHDACSTEHSVCAWVTPGWCSFCEARTAVGRKVAA